MVQVSTMLDTEKRNVARMMERGDWIFNKAQRCNDVIRIRLAETMNSRIGSILLSPDVIFL